MNNLPSKGHNRVKFIIVGSFLVIFCIFSIHEYQFYSPTADQIPAHGQGKKYHDNLNFPISTYISLSKDNFADKLSLTPIDIANASAVFNSINSVLDAPAGTIQPNGISVFTGYMPKGTLFYHGGHGDYNGFPDSPEWVATNWEYSFSFGVRDNVRRPGDNSSQFPPGKGHGSPPGNGDGSPPGDGNGPPPDRENGFPPSPFDESKDKHPSLLTFQNVKPLTKLLVLEGASAKKEDDGSMDIQNVLAGSNSTKYFGPGEKNLAKKICEWGNDKFGGLDGIVRMEVGFEIVICDFHSDKIKLVSNDTFFKNMDLLGFPDPLPLNESLDGQSTSDSNRSEEELALDEIRFNLANYMESRKGWEDFMRHYEPERKIKIDYRGFVSPINKTYISPDTYVRRFSNISSDLKEEFVHDLERIFKKNSNLINHWDGIDWQAYTKRIIDKFYPMLMIVNKTYENYQNDANLDFFVTNLTLFTFQPYSRYHDFKMRGDKTANEAALNHLMYEYTFPVGDLQSDGDVLIWSSISKVVHSIGSELFAQYEFAKKLLHIKYVKNGQAVDVTSVQSINEQISNHQESLLGLLDILNWTVNYNCEIKCPLDSICFIPTWGPNPFRSFTAEFGKEKDSNGILRIKKNCQCVKLKDIVGGPNLPFL